MRGFLIVCAVLGAAACNRADTHADAGTNDRDTRSGTDTVVHTTAVKDTTIVKADTTIHVDTLKKTDHVPDAAKRDSAKRK